MSKIIQPSRRRLIQTGLAGAAGLGLWGQSKAMNKTSDIPPTSLKPVGSPLIIGHRGAPGYRPEHTIASYETAIKLGADFIEPDLVATKDGFLVVRHDPILNDSTDVAAHPEFASRKRTVNIAGRDITDWFVADFTLAEIKTLRCKQVFPARDHSYDGQYQILTLEEVIDIAQSKTRETGRVIGIYPETKWPSLHLSMGLALEPRLLETLNKAGLTRADSPVIIQSFEQGNLKALRKLTDVRLMQLVSGSGLDPATGQVTLTAPDDRPFDWIASGRQIDGHPGTFADLLTPAGLDEVASYANVIAPWKGWLIGFKTDAATGVRSQITNKTLVDNAHARGLKVHTWTMRNDPTHLDAFYKGDPIAEYLDVFRLGVDGLFTDFADTAVAARAQFLKDQ